MTLAWYGHLKFKSAPMAVAIIISWFIALPEFALLVPANRLGYGTLTVYQLKILQMGISLAVFIGFAWREFREAPTWRYSGSFVLIFIALALALKK